MATDESSGRSGEPAADDAHRVGVFGDVLPECLVAAAGARCVPVHLMSPDPPPADPSVAARIEPFVDDHVRQFLFRFVAGQHGALRAIVFCREEAAGLAAYQYAAELRRQGLAPHGPRLILWNAVHRGGAGAATFNRRECERLWQELAALGMRMPDRAALSTAHAAELERQDALVHMEALRKALPPLLSGNEALRLRHAGRSLAPDAHAARLEEAVAAARAREGRSGLRIGFAGSALASAAALEAVEAFGTVVCDLLPQGEGWPLPLPPEPTLDAILEEAAAAPLCARVVPPERHREALVERLAAARCDLVLVQLSQGDDAFGWEVPALTRLLEEKGITVTNLGFRDSLPSQEWLEAARAAVAQHAEVQP